MSAEPTRLADLIARLPAPLARQAFTHASWTARRAESYERLAFLGDSVLGLAVTTHLFPRLGADAHGPGRLTKIRAQAVSGPSCRRVALALGLDERLREEAPEGMGRNVEALVDTERVLASVCEAAIGACYVEHGHAATMGAVQEAFAGEIDAALAAPEDPKSAFQELAAQRGESVGYEVVDESGPPHDRRFAVRALLDGRALARGEGRSKKEAEQDAARGALAELGA